MSLNFDPKVTTGTVLQLLIMIVIVVSAFAFIQNDVEKVKQEQKIQQQFRQDVRSNYINREQLDYIVIQRLDRMERNIDAKLERIEKAITN